MFGGLLSVSAWFPSWGARVVNTAVRLRRRKTQLPANKGVVHSGCGWAGTLFEVFEKGTVVRTAGFGF